MIRKNDHVYYVQLINIQSEAKMIMRNMHEMQVCRVKKVKYNKNEHYLL